jgi:hypothetical protein
LFSRQVGGDLAENSGKISASKEADTN